MNSQDLFPPRLIEKPKSRAARFFRPSPAGPFVRPPSPTRSSFHKVLSKVYTRGPANLMLDKTMGFCYTPGMHTNLIALPAPPPTLMLPKPYDAPSVEVARALQAAFDYFNENLFHAVFGHGLPKVVLNMSRRRNAVAFFAPKTWKDAEGKEFDEISLVPEYTNRTPVEVMSSLVHEMAHLKDHLEGTSCKNGYHGRAWTKIMARLGLPERPNRTRTGKLSRLSVSHTVQEGGPFEKAFQAMPEWVKLPFVTTGPRYQKAAEVDPDNRQGKRARYECPACASEKGHRAPVLRGPSGLVIKCGDHDEQYIETGF